MFARVDGFVAIFANGQRRVSVILDTGREIEIVRDIEIPGSLERPGAARLADQLVEEALANELAIDGWCVVGEGDTSSETHQMMDVIARSRSWVVKRG